MNNNNQSLEDIKKNINDKENQISKSQTKVITLENTNKKLERKRNIKRSWKSSATSILFYIVYNIIIGLLISTYIIPFIETFQIATSLQKTLNIVLFYIGISIISILGAYATSKLEKLLKRRASKKNIEITDQINKNQQRITKELELQEKLKKEITITLEHLNTCKKEISASEEKKDYFIERDNYEEEINYEDTNKISYIRRRKKY